jgi:selenocysteine lyase/cysteine desulfurase
MMSPDWNKYRDDFPVTQKYTYLNNAAISPIPKIVYQQATKFYRDSLYYGVHFEYMGKDDRANS